ETRAIVAGKIAACPSAPEAVRRRLLKEPATPGAPAEAASAEPFGGARAEASELSALFFAASAEERRLILLNLPYSPLPGATPLPPTVAREAIHRLEAAALGRNAEAFARELERTLAISRELARHLMDDESGEPIVIAAAALGMSAEVL